MAIARNTLFCLALLLPLALTMRDGAPHGGLTGTEDAHQDSLAAAVRNAIAGMTTPELEARRARRRTLQQEGYASLLSHALRSDGLWALVTYSRVSLQMEYSLPRTTLYVYVPIRRPPGRDSTGQRFYTFGSGPMAIPLHEDRSFPEDPWKP